MHVVRNSVNSFYKESENAVNSRLDSGNVIIKISIISKVLNNSVKCKYCDVDSSIEIYENSNRRTGLAVQLVVYCNNCGTECKFF